MDVKAGDFAEIQGYQYTMEFDPTMMEIVQVETVWTDLSGSNFGQARVHEGILTTSWNASEPTTLPADQVLYRVKVRARSSGQLSDGLTVNSKVTRAEAYDRDEELLDVRFRFDSGVTAGGNFALYQNEPNPFGDLTRIGFQLPEGGEAVLTVHDVTGKLVYTSRSEFHRGYNEFILRGTDVSARGMLYYTVQSGEHTATRRMIMQD
ncbi:MAG: T9SS type A sorting domain-containing protein [Saprospiraceae bacterium]|nr:T9SS type A sorting domain-containing protein [Saprospiraceae bacterium]